jgi:SAM-dependent methyltransferase
MKTEPSIVDVRYFWENNPLFAGESLYEPGTKDFFIEHRRVCIEDNLAGKIPDLIFPPEVKKEKVLDLGCGPGFWVIEYFQRGYKNLFAADLTDQGLQLTRQRCHIYDMSSVGLVQQTAEHLGFASGIFGHVNCQGVIHHTPDTQAAILDIWRVLKEEGTATISVYYRNIFLRLWPIIHLVGNLLTKFGARVPGRGRETIFREINIEEIVRLYDGVKNPIGKSYTRHQFFEMLSPCFDILEWRLHFFPARSLPFKIPHCLHRFLDRSCGFLILVKVKKKRGISSL